MGVDFSCLFPLWLLGGTRGWISYEWFRLFIFIMKKIFLFLFASCFNLMASAYDVESDGLCYNIIKKAKVAEFVDGTKVEGNIVIPTSIEYLEKSLHLMAHLN